MSLTTTTITQVLSSSLTYSVAWALLHFLWQGTALAALAGVAMALCRRAQIRYLLGVATLVLMLVAPLATLLLVNSQPGSGMDDTVRSSAPPRTRPQEQSVPSRPAGAAHARSVGQLAESPVSVSHIPVSPQALLWLVEAWLLGVAFFSLRSAGGFIVLERERRRKSALVNPRVLEICRTLERRLGIDRAIAYSECRWLQTPAVIGWFRPIVLLPVTVLTGLSEEQLRSIIAHELAHIRRFDSFVNVFQVCVETLLFYHPAIWWLNKRIREEREHCCDEMAVAVCGNAVEYARALTLLEELRSAPVLAMAANRSPLAERIARVLGLKTLGHGMRGAGLTGSIFCLTAALIAGNTLLGIAHPQLQNLLPAQAAAPIPPLTAQTASAPIMAQASAPAAKPSPARPQETAQPPATSSSSYIDGMKAAGFGDLTPNQLIALKIQNVTPEYVKEIQAQGLQPDVEKLIAMRVQDISPEYIRELRGSGLNFDINQLIALKIQGASSNYYAEIKDAGVQPSVNELIGMKVQGVTPEYVRELRAAGLALTSDEVIAMKVQNVTPQYLKAMHDLGLQPDSRNLIAMRVQDVTPDYVRDIQALGLKPTVNELIGMRVQDVTPEYIKALQDAGFNFDIHEIISAKVQDVTPEFIQEALKHGFKNLTLQKLIQLRHLGILEPKAEL